MLGAVGNNVRFLGLNPNVSNIGTFDGKTANYASIPAYKPDEFVKQDKEENKKKLSNQTKIGIGVGIATLATIAFFVAKGRMSEAKNLAEHIDFKSSQNIEDAIKFGKENLGIKSYDGFGANDLDAINWLNEGFVNVSNKMKGKLRMPKHVIFIDDSKVLGDHTMAGVVCGENLPKDLKKYSGYFYVNKKFFANPIKSLNQDLEKAMKVNIFETLENGKIKVNELYSAESANTLIEMIEDFKKNKSFNSAVKASNAIENMYKAFNSYSNNPLDTIKVLFKSKENCTYLKEAGLSTDLKEIQNLSLKDQKKLREKMVSLLEGRNAVNYVNKLILKDKEYATKLVENGFIAKPEIVDSIKFDKLLEIIDYTKEYTGKEICFLPIKLAVQDIEKTSPFTTIYHEMGHLQDMKPRCVTTDKCGYDYSKYPQELKNWVDNEEYIQVANRVSSYSTHGPGEFIAETFAKLIEGKKPSKEVMDLYKKLEGPTVPST